MKALYLLPIFSFNLFAHTDSTIHSHFIEYIVNSVVLFAYISLGISFIVFLKAIFRRFVWELKM